jgi:hypothetical protein
VFMISTLAENVFWEIKLALWSLYTSNLVTKLYECTKYCIMDVYIAPYYY